MSLTALEDLKGFSPSSVDFVERKKGYYNLHGVSFKFQALQDLISPDDARVTADDPVLPEGTSKYPPEHSITSQIPGEQLITPENRIAILQHLCRSELLEDEITLLARLFQHPNVQSHLTSEIPPIPRTPSPIESSTNVDFDFDYRTVGGSSQDFHNAMNPSTTFSRLDIARARPMSEHYSDLSQASDGFEQETSGQIYCETRIRCN
jgi:hypothetical protein